MKDLEKLLNKEQLEAVLHKEGPLLILAGAGSGKTRVLTYRIAHLIEECGIQPWNILAITFTNKAAGEMRERVNQMVGFGAESIWVSTFHSTCVRILRRHIDCIGYETNFTIYDTDDTKTVIKDVCKRLTIDTKIYRENSLRAAISNAKNEMITPEEFKAAASGDLALETTAKVYAAYQAQLKKNNALDFDDLLLKTVELFRSAPQVLEYYQDRFQYILVDEYQDTNTVQFEFVHLLADKYRNLCVVGDDDQSIYKFRGANIENILSFERHYPDAKVIKLEQNYRSTGNILNAANNVIANNRGRKAKRLWTSEGDGDKLRLVQFENGYEEAEYVVGDIRRKVNSAQAQYRDFAILYRTNAQARLFEEKLLVSGTPYKIIGGTNFYARREIKDMLAYLKTVDNGNDDVAVKRIINVPRRGIGATSIARVDDYAAANGMSFFDALAHADQIPGAGRAAGHIRSFAEPILVLRSKLGYVSVKEILEEIIDVTGYVRELKAEETDEAKDRIANIDELFSKIAAYEENEENPTLSGFLQEVALVADIDALEETQDYVVLMTLHSAKGLEFEQVYLTGMEDGLFPSFMSFAGEDPSDLEEERRLCYVGITRARKKLTLTCAHARMQRGEMQYNQPSRFLKEIPKELVEGAAADIPVRRRDDGFGSRGSFGSSGAGGFGSSAGGFGSRSGFGGDTGDTSGGRHYAHVVSGKKGSPYTSGHNYETSVFSGRQLQAQKADGLSYEVGDTVSHIKFGRGKVLEIKDGGRDYEVRVDFEKCGVKKMFASFAKLKKVD